MDILSDQLHSQVFQNLVDLTDFRNCRLVSQKWKRNVLEACRHKFHVVYPLTDSTLHTANQLKDALISFDIYAFSGKENNDAWATSGIEPLMQTTEWLQLSGSEVDTSEIQKILGLANNSLKTLSFKCLEKDLTCPLQKMQQCFGALRKLSIGYYSSSERENTFNTFTSTLEKWNSSDCSVQLPLLQSLNLYFDCRWESGYHQYYYYWNSPNRITSEDLFRNYIAIAKLLLKYKQTLREVQIERVFRECYYQSFSNLDQSRWTEMECGLEALDDLNLNRLKIATKPSSIVEYFGMSMSDAMCIEVLGRPKNLKNVLYNNLMCPNDRWSVLFATLPSLKHADDIYLTSVKINLSLPPTVDPTLAINLGGLKTCSNLKTLWLCINLRHNQIADLFVRNVELLPKGISILRFESTEVNRTKMGKEILVNQQQVRWIIDNLRELESCWMSLLIPEQINANENNEQREDANAAADEVDEDEDGIDGGGNAQPQQQVDINRLANINLDTFRDLLAMPKLKDLKVDMMKVRPIAARAALLAGNFQALRQGQGTTMDIIREYSDLSVAAGYATTTATTPSFGANFFFGFATLTAKKNQN